MAKLCFVETGRCRRDKGARMTITAGLAYLVLSLSIAIYVLRKQKRNSMAGVTFFHPFCDAGGGGERVLWSAIVCLQSQHPDLPITIICQDYSKSDAEILSKAKKTFNLQFNEKGIRFVRLRLCSLLKDSTYPRLTLLGQIVGSMVVGLEAAIKADPCDVLIDTLGNAFAYPAIRFLWPSVRIVAYTHYPFISGEMIDKVRRRETAFNNAGAVSRSPIISTAKVAYYRVLLLVYGWCGRMIDVAMANSSWTKGHLQAIWTTTPIHLVYPPCDVEPFLVKADDTKRGRDIVSLSQFRPEKGHRLQLEAFALFCESNTDKDVKLIMVGGCRDEADRQRVNELKQLSSQLAIADRVQFKTDLPFDQVCKSLRKSLIGLHTMREEHFGISVVEFMAAGLVTLAHGSGGPKADIIDPDVNGFLATDAEGYANALAKIYSLEESELDELRKKAKEKAQTAFSMQAFHQRFLSLLDATSSISPKGKQLT